MLTRGTPTRLRLTDSHHTAVMTGWLSRVPLITRLLTKEGTNLTH